MCSFKITKKIKSYIVKETKYATVNIEINTIEYQATCFVDTNNNLNVESIVDLEAAEIAEFQEEQLYLDLPDIEYGDLFVFIEFCVKNYLARKLQN